MNDIRKLEAELAEVEKAKKEYEEQIAGESQSQVSFYFAICRLVLLT